MAEIEIQSWLRLIPSLLPYQNVWTHYDAEADVLYIDFKKPSVADDTEMTADDILIRYAGTEVVGITVLHAKTRVAV